MYIFAFIDKCFTYVLLFDMDVNLVLHKSKKRKSDGRHPVVIRITQGRKYKDRFVKGGHYYHLAEWNTKNNLPKGASTTVKKQLQSIITQYTNAIADFEGMDISIDAVIDRATTNKKKAPTVLEYYDMIITRLRTNDQIKTALSYTGARANLISFIEQDKPLSEKMMFAEISVPMLNRYKTWLDGWHQRGGKPKYKLSGNTKHIYLRTLRSVYNKAITDGYAKQSNYPFKAFFADKSFDTETEKKAITSDDIANIAALNFTGDQMRLEAQQYFLFGYYGMGINFVDIARLKWSSIVDGNILYKRSKLRHKKKKQKVFSIPVKGVIKEILDYYRPLSGVDPDNYIFPILNKRFHITPTQQHDRIQKVITRVNRDLKLIGIKAGISKKISTYTWRHTAFTVLKLERNIPVAMISQVAGHSSVAVTETYLDSFGTDAEQEIYGVL